MDTVEKGIVSHYTGTKMKTNGADKCRPPTVPLLFPIDNGIRRWLDLLWSNGRGGSYMFLIETKTRRTRKDYCGYIPARNPEKAGAMATCNCFEVARYKLRRGGD